MKALAGLGVALAVCWFIDQTMSDGRYFAALGRMVGDVVRFSR
jgi:hypothetical protein